MNRLTSPLLAGRGLARRAGRAHALCWLVWVLLGLLPARALAEPDTLAVLGLRLNHVGRQEVYPRLRQDDVLLPLEDLERAGVDVRRLGGQQETVEGKRYVSLRSLAPEVSYVLDEHATLLELTVAPRLLPATQVDLRPPSTRANPSREASAYLNYGANWRSSRLTLTGEAGAGVGDMLLSTTAFWSSGARVTRGLTQLTIDKPGPMLRAVVGDNAVQGGLLGGGAVLGGFHLARNFELDPSFMETPSFHLQGSATTPSSVEVYVNGARVRRVDLPPGPFDLANLPLTQGMMGAQYVLRDAFGREQQVSMSQYVASGLLAEGVSAFNVSLGLVRENLATESFQYGAPALLGQYRRGLSTRLTASARLEASRSLVSGGGVATFGLSLGQVELGAAGSVASGQGGVAGSAAYKLQASRLGLQAFARAMSPSYSTLGLSLDQDHPLLTTGASVSASFSARWRMSLEVSSGRYQRAGASVRTELNSSLRLTPRSQLSMAVGAATFGAGRAYTGSVALTVDLGARTSGSVAGQQRQGGPSMAFSLQRSAGSETGLSYQLRGEAAASPWGSAMASYQGAHGLIRGGLNLYQGQLEPELGASGSLVAMGGQVKLSRPVGQGFALVQVPGLPNARIFVNNHEVARTGSDGTALIPNLLPFFANRVSISDQDIPTDFGVPDLTQIVAPYARRGALVRFSSRRISPIRGTLLLDGADAAALAYGELTLQSGLDVFHSPIGRQGEFELEGLAPGAYTARVTYGGGTCLARLVVSSTEALLVDLGEVPCHTSPSQEP